MSQTLSPQVDQTSLVCAADGDHVEVASLLLQRGADIEAKDNVRISPTYRDFCIIFLILKTLLPFLYLSVYLFFSLSPSFPVCFSLSLFFFFFYVSRRIPDRNFLIFNFNHETRIKPPSRFQNDLFSRNSDCAFKSLSCDHIFIVVPRMPCLTPSCLRTLAGLLFYVLPTEDILRSHHFCFSAEQI